MSALRNPVIGLLTLHMSKPSQHATTNNTIHTLDTHPTPELFTFLLSFRVTPDIHLTILFSVLTSLRISTAFIGQVSLPYTSTLCTHALYIFPFTFNEAPLAVNNPLKSLNFPQSHLTLALDASSAPPPFPITSPK